MHTYNIAAQIHYLKTCCTDIDWRRVDSDSALNAINQLLARSPSENSWEALMELFAAWSDITNIREWVQLLEPRIDHWPWNMRNSVLGQAQTRAEKSCVYRLIGKLVIRDCEDLSGHRLKQWSSNEDWRHLKGIVLRKIETEAMHLHDFFASPYLNGLHTIELNGVEGLSGKLAQLFNDLPLSNLSELRLASLNITPQDVADVSQRAFAAQLKSLDLSNNFITGNDLMSIVGSGQFPSLQHLMMNYCDVSADHLTAIFEKLNHPTLAEITFEGTAAAKSIGKGILVKPI